MRHGVWLLVWLMASSAGAVVVERVVAQVNGEIITESQVIERERSMVNDLYRAQLPAEQLEERLAEARQNLLVNMIDEHLLRQKAEQLGLSVSEEQVDSVLESIMQANGIPDMASLEARLSAEGMSVTQLRDSIKDRTLLEKVKQYEIVSRIVVTDEEIERYYDEHPEEFREPSELRLRELVLLSEERPPAEVQREAQEILRMWENGTDFAELATFFSQAPSADHGGDMGYMEESLLAEQIREVARKLEPGEVSQPIRTDFGYHLIKLEDRKSQRTQPLVDVKSEIREQLLNQRYEDAMREFMLEVRSNAYVKVWPAPPGAREFSVSAEYGD